MNSKTKNMLHHLAEHAGNGEATTKNLFGRLKNLDLKSLKNPRTLWTAAGVAGLIGAGLAWRYMRNRTKTAAL